MITPSEESNADSLNCQTEATDLQNFPVGVFLSNIFWMEILRRSRKKLWS